jgi:hypothetical protein
MYRSKAAVWSPVTLAAAAALLVVLAVTETFGRRSVFCSSTTCFVEGVLWSLPSYAAMLAIVIAAGRIAAALVRARVGPSSMRIVALSAAVAGAVAYITVSVVSLDAAWVGAFSGQLSPPPPALRLPPALATLTAPLGTLSLMLLGVSIALTSLLLPLRAPTPLAILGWIAGVAVAAIPSAQMYTSAQISTAYRYALPAAFFTVTVWALWLAVVQIKRARQLRRVP